MTIAQEYDLRLNALITAFRTCTLPEVRYNLARTIYDFQHTPPSRYTAPPAADLHLEEDIRRAMRELEREHFDGLPFYHRAYIHLGRWIGVVQ